MNTPDTNPVPFYEESDPEMEAVFRAAALFAGDVGTRLDCPPEMLMLKACEECLKLPKEVFASHPDGFRARAMLVSAVAAMKGGA